jgi:hypothetical protein
LASIRLWLYTFFVAVEHPPISFILSLVVSMPSALQLVFDSIPFGFHPSTILLTSRLGGSELFDKELA